MSTVTLETLEIDWAYEWRLIRWRRLSVSRSARWSFHLGASWCYLCQRMVFSFAIGKFYGSINCRDARDTVPPLIGTVATVEWPEWVGSDDEFFDEFTEIAAK